MSWWVYLNDPEVHADDECECRTLTVERHAEGGTYALGGTDEACINVTYNYGKHFRTAMPALADGLNSLDSMQAATALPYLEQGVAVLGIDRDDDYWAPTAGNAGHVLSILAAWARQHPSGVFAVY